MFVRAQAMTAFTGIIHGFRIRLKIHTSPDYRNGESYGFMRADSAIENIGTCSPSRYHHALHYPALYK